MTETATRLMKDSGVGWIGSVPDHWELSRVGACFEERKTTVSDLDFAPLSVTKRGVVPQLETAAKSDNGEARKLIRAGDFVINSRSDRKGSAGLAETDGSTSVIYTVLNPRRLQGAYVHHMLRSEPFQEEYYRWGSGIVADLWSTRYSAMKQIAIPVPPFEEQGAIASFLDRETGQIDALIDKQQQLIETLAERRKAVITRAVTRGLDPTVPMKPSGVEWLGEIPVHWAAANVKRAYRLTLGKMVNAGDLAGGIEMAYLRAGNIQETGIDISEVKTMTFTPTEATTLTLLAGDVVVVEGGGGYGRSDFLKHDLVGWGFQNHVIRARPSAGHSGKFFDYFVKFLRGIGHFEKLSSFATIPNVSAEKLGSIEFPIATQIEQEEIVSYLDAETGAMDALALKASSVIELLKERRQALISAAVTGKIDVRGIA